MTSKQLNVLGTLVWVVDEATGNRYRSMLQVSAATIEDVRALGSRGGSRTGWEPKRELRRPTQ